MAETNSNPDPAKNEKTHVSMNTPAAAAAATPTESVSPTPAMVFAPVEPLVKDKAFRIAYEDAYAILSEDNPCSRFFGGSPAIEALNDLVLRSKREHLPHTVGFRQSGETTMIVNNATRLRYRSFDKAMVNSRGAFFMKTISFSDAVIPNVGKFAANSREARVLILLHELAHLIAAPDGKWLIPDDGKDNAQSARNTELIERKCRAQINALS